MDFHLPERPEMKPKTLMLLAVAGSCGLVAMLGVQQVMSSQPAPAKVAVAKVLVATDSIQTGTKLTADNTTFRKMPIDSVPEDAITKEEDILDRAAKVSMMSGDVIRKTKVTEKGEWGKSVNIPPGMRVIGIPVDESHTISGLIRPGDRVDVLVTYQGRGERGSQVSKTKTLLEYVEVFGMDDQTASHMDDNAKSAHAKVASLIVTPEQTNYLILAQKKGTLSLSWRRRSDDELVQTKEADEKLMEELEGTVGTNDYGGFHGRGFAEEEGFTDRSSSPSPQQFLSETSAAEPVEPVVAAPPVPMWTVEVYIGNDALAQQFELPAE